VGGLKVSERRHASLSEAARARDYVSGLTHEFYPYPGRFSPRFARAAILAFSKPGDIVLDPYMGGGTTVVEALANERHAVGVDINSLSLFLARVKTVPLSRKDEKAVLAWATSLSEQLSYRAPKEELLVQLNDRRTRNLSAPELRALKKAIAICLASSDELPSQRAQDFARCVTLRTAKVALDGRKIPQPLWVFRQRLLEYTRAMIEDMSVFRAAVGQRTQQPIRKLLNIDAADLAQDQFAACPRQHVDLVVTSPPYAGVHVLYHRWQVQGGRETPAPYWIARCEDGQGESYYNFGDRRESSLDTYFDVSLETLNSVRRVMRRGAYMVQMVAFADPRRHLPRYLRNMSRAGFVEARPPNGRRRIGRITPNRKWHARLKGETCGAREIVLVHRAT